MQAPPPPPNVPPMPNQQPPQGYQTMPPPPPKQKFPVWAIVLLSCGGCAVLGVIVLAAVLFPVFAQAREKARQTSCLSNMKRMGTSLAMYMQDYDERMPPAAEWMDVNVPYMSDEKFFHCPSAAQDDKSAYGYAFNEELSGVSLARIANPAFGTMIFESSKTGRNETDPLQSVMNPPRHYRTVNNATYIDGHAKSLRGGEALIGGGKPEIGSDSQFP